MIATRFAPLVAFLCTTALTPLVRNWARRSGQHLDVPNERSSHTRPIPRTGGWAILAGIVAASAATGAFADRLLAIAVAAAAVLALAALRDERSALPRAWRFLLQIGLAAATVTAAGMTTLSAGVPFLATLTLVAAALGIGWIVALTNAYNFMDGLNGIASKEAIICGATMAVLALRASDAPAVALSLALCGAALGFLPWNLTGTIFMGDAGSATFGFLFAVLALRLAPRASFIAAALPLLPFVLDSGVTLVRRALRGERFFSTPHRSHFYQQLHRQGWTHQAVSALNSALAIVCSSVALLWQWLSVSERVASLGVLVALHAVIFLAIDLRSRQLAGARQ